MDRRKCEWRLLLIWSVGGGAVFLILLFQQLGGIFDADAAHAWSWFTAAALPTPMLLLGSFLAGQGARLKIERRAYYLVLGLCVVNVSLLLIASTAFAFQVEKKAVDLLAQSVLYLGPVQSCVSLAFGRLFGMQPQE